MISNLTKYIKFGPLYGAVEHYNRNETTQYSILILKKKKNEFIVENKKQASDLNEITKTIPKGQHLFLIINDNQVLSKLIYPELNEDKALQKGFPNIKISDFYYEITQLENATYISICRKEYIQTLVDTYKELKISIVGFSLGNNSAPQLVPYLESRNVSTSNATLAITNSLITSIDLKVQIEQKPYTINGIEVSNNYSLCLAGIITYFTNNRISLNNFKNYNTSLLKDFTQKRIFSLGLKTGIAILFISLLVNFLVFDYYNKQIDTLTQKTQINQAQKEQLLQLNKQLNSKKKLVDAIVNSTASKTSYYFDQLGSTVPTTISLISIAFQPILKKIEANKKIQVDSKTLFIKGTSSNGQNFSNWIQHLEKLEWIKSTEIINYGTGKKTKTTFELRIILT